MSEHFATRQDYTLSDVMHAHVCGLLIDVNRLEVPPHGMRWIRETAGCKGIGG
jgi:hypothetical protein